MSRNATRLHLPVVVFSVCCCLLVLGQAVGCSAEDSTTKPQMKGRVVSVNISFDESLFASEAYPDRPFHLYDEGYVVVPVTVGVIPTGWRSSSVDSGQRPNSQIEFSQGPVTMYPGVVERFTSLFEVPGNFCAVVVGLQDHKFITEQTLRPTAVTSTCVPVPASFSSLSVEDAIKDLPPGRSIEEPVELLIDTPIGGQVVGAALTHITALDQLANRNPNAD